MIIKLVTCNREKEAFHRKAAQTRQMLQKVRTFCFDAAEAASKSKTRVKVMEFKFLDKKGMTVETLFLPKSLNKLSKRTERCRRPWLSRVRTSTSYKLF